MNSENARVASGGPGDEEAKIDKSLRRMKPIERKPAEASSPTDSLHTDSEGEN